MAKRKVIRMVLVLDTGLVRVSEVSVGKILLLNWNSRFLVWWCLNTRRLNKSSNFDFAFHCYSDPKMVLTACTYSHKNASRLLKENDSVVWSLAPFAVWAMQTVRLTW